MIKIETVKINNLSDCTYAFLKAYNGPPWNYNWTYERAFKYLSEYIGYQKFVGFALYDDEKVAGAIFGHTKTWWTNDQLMIDEIFIAGDKQGMGYGKTLLQSCDRYAKEHQIGSVVLMTNRYMPAHKFYEKIGYTTYEPYVFMFNQILP